MLNAKPAASSGKVIFWCAMAFAVVLCAVYQTDTLTDTPTGRPANRISAVGDKPHVLTRPAYTPEALSPLATVICLSSDCSPVASEPPPVAQDDKIPRRTVINEYLEGVRRGDPAALSAVRQALDSCLTNHRNRLVSENAFEVASDAEADECGASELADLVDRTETAVREGFNPAHPRDSNSRFALLGWLVSKALLDDTSRQLANLPKLQPDADGAIFFDDVPRPERVSPNWNEVLRFAQEYGQSDPEMMMASVAAAELAAGPSLTVE